MVYAIISLKVSELTCDILHISKQLEDSVIELYHLNKAYDNSKYDIRITKNNRIEIYTKVEGYIYGNTKYLYEIIEICHYDDEIN